MAEQYTPELGQAAFGQPNQQYECPAIWEAAIHMLGRDIERVIWNLEQRDANPMNNSGERFDCPVFSAHAYSWADDDQPWNFKWRDVRISWYKYAGRGMSANRELTPDEASQMLKECMAALEAHEGADQ